MEKYKILVADDDRELANSIKMMLKKEGYEITTVFDGIAALDKIKEEKPDLILLDYDMPGMTGYEVCKNMRKSHATSYIPVIILSGVRTTTYDKITGLEAGADDYVTKPFEPDELKIRVTRLLRRVKEMISLNPLTKLPGSTRIEEEVTGRINSGEKFAVGYVDLDHFKAYNDIYGYKKGDNVINLLNQVVFEAINLNGNPNDFIGHIGGDDFIIVTSVGKIENTCEYITKNFDMRIPAYYSAEDREKGFIITTDRQGKQSKFPIMTVSIGVSTNEKREITHYGELIDILVEMKKYTKSLEQRTGSVFAKDRRASHTNYFGEKHNE